MLRTTTKRKTFKTTIHIKFFVGHYPTNGWMGDTDPLPSYVTLTK